MNKQINSTKTASCHMNKMGLLCPDKVKHSVLLKNTRFGNFIVFKTKSHFSTSYLKMIF